MPVHPVTIFALVNDTEHKVSLLLDKNIVETADDDSTLLWFHPMENNASTGVTLAHLRRFLTAIQHEPTVVDLSQ